LEIPLSNPKYLVGIRINGFILWNLEEGEKVL